jgi:ABC-type phosphate transport system permease subunit
MVFATTLLLLGIVVFLNLFAIALRQRLRRTYATAAV